MGFFPSTASTSLKTTLVLKDVEIFLQQYEYVGSGVCSIATNDITLTPATSPSFTVDALISTQPTNNVVVADGSKVLEGKVSDNDADSVTFDATATVDYSDGSAGAATDFTESA